MYWILIALIGHTANGFAFVIDKILLKNAFKRSATYAGLVGLLSGLVVFLIPWVDKWPSGGSLALAILSGITFMGGLWTFFTALSRGEASRVVPIISALIPILTLIGTTIFLGERLTIMQLIGFFLLITATVLLTGNFSKERSNRIKWSVILIMILSAVFFAITSISAKAVYSDVGFLSGFVSTRIVASITAIILAMLIDPLSGSEMIEIFTSHNKKENKQEKKKSGFKIKKSTAAKLAITGQILGGIGYVSIQYATSLGSASLVNALQVMQFALLVVVAFFMKSRAKELLGESLNKSVIIIKAIALVIMAIGLAMVIK